MLATIFGTLAAKIAAVGVAAAAATGGLAATGSLPAPAQDAVAAAVSHVGVHFPTSDDADTTAQEPEDAPDSGAQEDDGTDDGAGTSADANEHGKTVSETAKTTELTGREKGQEIADIASSKADDHRQDDDEEDADASQNPNGYGPDNHPGKP